MTSFNVKAMLDPVRTSREEGRLQGRKEMRDQIRDQFATFASRHPDPIISDELWTFVNWIERERLS
jgi:hypothetical protein